MTNILFFIAFLISLSDSTCPPYSHIKPCECTSTSDENLNCGGDEYFSVNNISEQIKIFHGSDNYQFYQLWLNNTDVPNFKNHQQTYNLFNLINSMTNLEEFVLMRTNIDGLPGKKLTCENIINIRAYDLNVINNYAYYSLSNIRTTTLMGNYNLIPSNAFVVENYGQNKEFDIAFSSSEVSPSSFRPGVFINPGRILHLKFFSNPKLNYLSRNIFEPLFDNYPNSTITFYNNTLDCYDCNLEWIIDRRDELLPKIFFAKCSDGQSFYGLRVNNFHHCHQNNVPTTTTNTINGDICNENGKYNGKYQISYWPPVGVGIASEGKCNYGNGNARWMCQQNGLFDENGPDLSECWLDNIVIQARNINRISDVIEIVEVLTEKNANHSSLATYEELREIMILTKKLQKFIESNNEEIDSKMARQRTNNFIHLFSNLINQNDAWNNATDSQKTEIASEILLYIQKTSFTLNCKQDSTDDSEVITSENIILETYHTDFTRKVLFEANGSSILIPNEVDLKSRHTCDFSAVGALIRGLSEYLLNGISDKQIINTEIIAFSITNDNETIEIDNQKKVRISLKHKSKLLFGDKAICIFWDFKSMEWSPSGCELVFLDSNRDISVCECNHLTNFAAIMDLSGRENDDFVKSLLTHICSGLSTICLMITILLMVFSDKKRSNHFTESFIKNKNKITCNLCICMITTNLLIIFGMGRTENKPLCRTVSVSLLYSLLASFSWMFLQGFHLYRMVVNVFSTNLKKYLIFTFGYGTPIIICIIAFTIIWFKENVFLEALTGDYFCWISSKKYPSNMWIIIGPAIVVVLMNTIFISIFMRKSFCNRKIIKNDEKLKSGANWKQIFAFTSILCNLGFTWLLFILYIKQFGSYSSYFSYVFIILNGLQGVFIFIYYLTIFISKKAKSSRTPIRPKPMNK